MTVIDLAVVGSEGSLLLDNAFKVLGVSVRDKVAQIVEAASDPLLTVSREKVENARLTLTNPRARLAAEVAWLPGVAPGRALKIVETLGTDSPVDELQAGLPPVARANVLAWALDRSRASSANSAVASLRQILQAVDAVDAADLLREVNEDRALAAVPLVRSKEQIIQAWEAQRRAYVQVFRRYLDKLPSEDLVEATTRLVYSETKAGRSAPSELLENLLDAYEVELLSFLEAEGATIRKLADAIVAAGSKGEAHVRLAGDRLICMLEAWDVVAQPLQIIGKARGGGHALSRSLANEVRGATVEMVNQHGLVDLAAVINRALAKHFSETADLRDVFEDDASTLEDMRQRAADRERSEASEVYVAKVGLGQTLLSINGREIVWGRETFAVHELDRVRWGGTSHSVNGIPTGTTYLIAFGAGRRECQVNTRSKQVFDEFTSRLWRTCGVAIAVRMLGALRAGEQVRVGEIQFSDDDVVLTKPKFFGKAEARTYNWREVQVWSAAGRFYVSAKSDKSFQANASYRDHDNTHVMSNIVNNAFDRGIVKLSGVLG